MKKELTISAIKDGTVIDHIPSNATFEVADILGLESIKSMVSVATNLPSKHIGKKGIVKIAGKYLTQEEVNKIAIVAPDATVNIIESYNVKKKLKVSIPDKIDKVIKCSNPNCITNVEKIETKFSVLSKAPLKIRCHYCERDMSKEDIEIV